MKPKLLSFSNRSWTVLALAMTVTAISTLHTNAATRTWTGNTTTDVSLLDGFDAVTVSGSDQWVFGAAGTAGTTLTNTASNLVLANTGTPAILFNAGAPAYTFTGNSITLGTGATSGVTVTNNSGVKQTFAFTGGTGVNVSSSFVLYLNGGTGGLDFSTGIVNKTLNFTIQTGAGAGLINIGSLDMGTANTGVTINGLATNVAVGSITAAGGPNNPAFTWNGSGTLTLTGTSTHTGNTNLTNGTVLLNNTLNAGATFYASGATVLQSNTSSINANVTVVVNSKTLTLTGANNYTGSTNANGGTLLLDFSGATVTDNIVNNTNNNSALFLANGNLTIKGASGATNSQRFNGTNFVKNSSSQLVVNQNGATAVNLTLGTITRNAGSTTDITLPTAGGISTASTTFASNSVLTGSASNGVAFATVNGGTTWATNVGGVLGALSTYSTGTGNYVVGNNVDVTNGDTVSGVTVNTLRINGGSTTLNLSGTNILNNGGLLVTPTGTNAVITGGNLTGNATTREVAIHNYANLALNTTLVDNGGATAFTFAGTGATTVNNANSYTGDTYLSSGTVITTNAQSLGVNSVLNFSTNLTSKLQMNAALNVGALSGGGATAGNASGGNIDLGANVLTFGAANSSYTYSGTISNTGSLVKEGTGTQILNGASTFSGGSIIKSGTLGIYSATGAGTGKIVIGDTVGSNAATLGRSGGNTVTNAIEVVGTGARTIASTGGGNTNSGTIKLDTDLTISNSSNNAFTLSGAMSNLTKGGNLTFTSTSAGSSITASGSLNFTGSIKNSGFAGSTTTISGIIGSSVTTVTADTGTLTLNAANLYAGGTTINAAATLTTGTSGTIGLGNVTVIAGGRLTLGNGSSFADNAILFYNSASSSVITLGGGNDTLGGITDTSDNQVLAEGTYTASQLNSILGGTAFTGSGTLTVVPEPSSLALIGLGMASLTFRRNRRTQRA